MSATMIAIERRPRTTSRIYPRVVSGLSAGCDNSASYPDQLYNYRRRFVNPVVLRFGLIFAPETLQDAPLSALHFETIRAKTPSRRLVFIL
jgi:hypothetical protein